MKFLEFEVTSLRLTNDKTAQLRHLTKTNKTAFTFGVRKSPPDNRGTLPTEGCYSPSIRLHTIF